MEVFNYEYSPDDLAKIPLGSSVEGNNSDFDKKVKERWFYLMKNGSFRYDLSEIHNREIPGKFNYVASCNIKRSTMRRMPENMTSLRQSFDHEKFNFTKISPEKEMICKLVRKPGTSNLNGNGHKSMDEAQELGCQAAITNGGQQQADGPDHEDWLVINVSPVDEGHNLLMPQGNLCLPQIVTEYGMTQALEIMWLSSSTDLRMGFNSLCAHASVNHFHFHAFYFYHKQYIQHAKLEKVCDDYLYEFSPESPYPAQAWVFVLRRPEDIPKIAGKIFMLTDYLSRQDVAHNMYLAYGEDPTGKGQGSKDCIRIFVWARNKVIGAKDPAAIVIAVIELSGELLIFSEERFKSITEEQIAEAQAEATHYEFNRLKKPVQDMFKASSGGQ